MNIVELRNKAKGMSKEELDKFAEDFGGGLNDPLKIERAFIDHPAYERRMAQLLGLKTEEEKRTQAAIEAAKVAKFATIAASISALSALISLIVLIITL